MDTSVGMAGGSLAEDDDGASQFYSTAPLGRMAVSKAIGGVMDISRYEILSEAKGRPIIRYAVVRGDTVYLSNS